MEFRIPDPAEPLLGAYSVFLMWVFGYHFVSKIHWNRITPLEHIQAVRENFLVGRCSESFRIRISFNMRYVITLTLMRQCAQYQPSGPSTCAYFKTPTSYGKGPTRSLSSFWRICD